jgi:transposase-like protein
MQMVGSFAEFERAMMRERTQAGLAAARARGRHGGRRPTLQPDQQAALVALVRTGQKTQADVARLFRVHPATVSRLMAAHRQPGSPGEPSWQPAGADATPPQGAPDAPTLRQRTSRKAQPHHATDARLNRGTHRHP